MTGLLIVIWKITLLMFVFIELLSIGIILLILSPAFTPKKSSLHGQDSNTTLKGRKELDEGIFKVFSTNKCGETGEVKIMSSTISF